MITKEKLLKRLSRPTAWGIRHAIDNYDTSESDSIFFDVNESYIYATNNYELGELFLHNDYFLKIGVFFSIKDGLLIYIDEDEDEDAHESMKPYHFNFIYPNAIWDIKEFEKIVAESAEKAIKEYWTDYIKAEYQKLIQTTGEEK
jgi:hypothetical protein